VHRFDWILHVGGTLIEGVDLCTEANEHAAAKATALEVQPDRHDGNAERPVVRRLAFERDARGPRLQLL
jgi:hypothetical protein